MMKVLKCICSSSPCRKVWPRAGHRRAAISFAAALLACVGAARAVDITGAGLTLTGGTVNLNGQRIMATGDSITYGVGGGNAGYRGYLYNSLTTAGDSFLYVGTQTANSGALPTNQQHQEGHSSWFVDDVANGVTPFTQLAPRTTSSPGGIQPGLGWMATNTPDIMTLMIGTNDGGYYDKSYSIQQLTSILDTVHFNSPNTKIYVAQIIPQTLSQATIDFGPQYNADMATLVNSKLAAGYNLALVDLYDGFPSDGLSGDRIHPNNTGYTWMAAQWYNAIRAGTVASTTLSGNPTVTFGNGTLDLAGFNQQVASLSSQVLNSSTGSVQNSNTSMSSTLTLAPAGGSTTFSGVIAGGGTLGAVNLNLKGTGVQVLSGANTYVGSTFISGGTLQLGAANSLPAGTQLLLSNSAGAVFDLHGYNQTVALLNGGGTTGGNISLGAGTLTIGTGGGYVSQGTVFGGGFFYGNISGGGSLVMAGTGVQTLSGTNSYTGPTTITAGILRAKSAAALPNYATQTISLTTRGAMLAVNAGAGSPTEFSSTEIGNLLGNSKVTFVAGTSLGIDTSSGNFPCSLSIAKANMGLTKLGANTLTPSGSNSYNGATTLTGGNLLVGSAENAGTSGPLGNPTTPAGSIVFNGGTLQYSSSNTYDYSARFTTTGNYPYSIDTNNQNVTFASGLGVSGTSGLTKLGAKTLTLSGSNTYSGPTTVFAGTLQAGITSVAGVSGAFGKNSAVTLANTAGVVLALNGYNTRIGSLAGGGTTGGNVTCGTATLTVGGLNTDTTYAGVLSSSAGTRMVSLNKIGTGQLTLDRANTYTGKTVIDGANSRIYATEGNGTLADAKLGTIPAVFQADNITIKNGGSLNLASGTDGRSLSANRGIYLDGTGRNYINTGTGDFSVNGVISGPGGLGHINLSDGFRRLYLTAANTFTGDTWFDGTNSSGSYGGINISNALALQYSALDTTSVGSNFGAPANLICGGLVGNGAFGTGGITGSTLTSITLQPQIVGLTKTYSGVLSGAAGMTLTLNGPGIQALNGANTYTGATTIQNGVLSINKIDAGGVSSSLGNNTLAVTLGGTSTSGTLSYTGGTGSASRALIVAGGGGEIDNTTGTLTLSSAVTGTGNALTVGGAGNIIFNSGINTGAGGSLTKKDAGKVTLSGSNTYTGATTISDGTLALGVNGSFNNSSTIVVGDAGSSGAVLDLTAKIGAFHITGGTLKGIGTVNLGSGTLTVDSGAHLSPGNSLPGALQLSGNLSLASSAVMDFELDTPGTSDKVLMPLGTLILSDQQFSDFKFSTLDGGGFGRGEYTLIDAGLVIGKLGSNLSGKIGDWSALIEVRNNDLVLSVVPEPSTLALLVAGLVVGFGAWRRRKGLGIGEEEEID
ncbi:MAG: autotransporter-associated beta strand repeat-containing protein [Planctomycetota bacterium]